MWHGVCLIVVLVATTAHSFELGFLDGLFQINHPAPEGATELFENPTTATSAPAETCYVSKVPLQPSRQWPPLGDEVGTFAKEKCPKTKWVNGCFVQSWTISALNQIKYPEYPMDQRVYLGGCKAAMPDDEDLFTTNEKLSQMERNVYTQSLNSYSYGNKNEVVTIVCMTTDCNIPQSPGDIRGWRMPEPSNSTATSVADESTSPPEKADTFDETGAWKYNVHPSLTMALPGLLLSFGFSSMSIASSHLYILFSSLKWVADYTG